MWIRYRYYSIRKMKSSANKHKISYKYCRSDRIHNIRKYNNERLSIKNLYLKEKFAQLGDQNKLLKLENDL